jgi:glutamyl-tRNA synthetase
MAPSPTGYFHVGSARTALYSWLYARQHGGRFVLRIEDTDRERSTQASIDVILASMTWLGLDWDEGPIYQSQNLSRHAAAAEQLLAAGKAYRCYATTEEITAAREAAKAKGIPSWKYIAPDCVISLDEQARRAAAGEPAVVRFAVPRAGGPVTFDDMVYGPQSIDPNELEDFVLLRADGSPLYMLSVVCDDIDEGITHIVRGQDHLSNTPKQVLLYQALGAPQPRFAHMSLIMAPDGAKLSKRKHGEVVSITTYRDRGFLPQALVQWLGTVGYGAADSGDGEELLDRAALLERFDLTRIGRANAKFIFDPHNPRQWTDAKAQSINAAWVRNMPFEQLRPHLRQRLADAGLWQAEFEGSRAEWFRATVELIRTRYWTLTDFTEQGAAYFGDEVAYDPAAVKKNLQKDPRLAQWLPALAERLEHLPEFTAEAIETALRGLAEEVGVGAGLLINGLRTAVTGQSVGPGAFELCLAIGRERVTARLTRAPELMDG